MELIESVILVIVSSLFGVVSYVAKSKYDENKNLKHQINESNKQQDSAIKLGLSCLLRKQLMDMHEKYTNQDYITIHGKEAWDKMFNAYHELGGNGLIADFDEDVQELSIKRT